MLRHERLQCNNSITQDASTSALLHARQDERHGVSGLIKVYCVRAHAFQGDLPQQCACRGDGEVQSRHEKAIATFSKHYKAMASFTRKEQALECEMC